MTDVRRPARDGTMRRWVITLLLFINALLVGWIGWVSSPNKTETGHMAAAVYVWHTLRFDVFHVNPPLTRVITGLPVSLCRPKHNWDSYSSRPQDRSEWVLGTALLKANSRQTTRWCFALARWSLIPLLLLGGYCGCRLSRETYGNAAGLFFLTLWCFSPLLLSWGATNCPGAAAAALGIAAVYTFRRWLHKPNWPRATMAGACLGLLPLTKLTWIIALGLWPSIWCLWTMPTWFRRADTRAPAHPPLRQLAVVLLVGLYVLNLGYLFDGTFRPLGKYEFVSQLLHGQEVAEDAHWSDISGNRFSRTWLGKIPVPLPTEFVQGIDTQRYDFERGLPSYLRGQWRDHGWWYYYLYALAVKVPLGTCCVVALAAVVTIFGRGYSTSWRDEMLVLAPGLAILTFVSSQTGFSVHSRYVIPALPFFFIWTSKIARVFEMRPITQKRRALAAIVVLALTWSVGSSLWVYPHSLSYFNEVVGGPKNGGEHLLHSNIDWGQDLLYLKRWLGRHPEALRLEAACYGACAPGYAGIRHVPPPPGPDAGWRGPQRADELGPLPGWYAVSVNNIRSHDRKYRYFLHCEPTAMAGYSIYIYHVTPAEANRVRQELGLPELAEGWGSSEVGYDGRGGD